MGIEVGVINNSFLYALYQMHGNYASARDLHMYADNTNNSGLSTPVRCTDINGSFVTMRALILLSVGNNLGQLK